MLTQTFRVVAASFMLAALALAPESAAQQRVGTIGIEDPWVATTNPAPRSLVATSRCATQAHNPIV